jgi:hypothetical protein
MPIVGKPPDFSQVKVGDEVFHIRHGLSTIFEIIPLSFGVPETIYRAKSQSLEVFEFRENGKYRPQDMFTSVYHSEPAILYQPEVEETEEAVERWEVFNSKIPNVIYNLEREANNHIERSGGEKLRLTGTRKAKDGKWELMSRDFTSQDVGKFLPEGRITMYGWIRG